MKGIESLTPREKEVAKLVGDGLTSEEIAKKLEIDKRTVDTHRHNISIKLGLSNLRQDLIKQYVKALPGE